MAQQSTRKKFKRELDRLFPKVKIFCHYSPLGACSKHAKAGSNYCRKHDDIMKRRYESND